MPKQIGTQTLDLSLVRSISSFSVTVGSTPGTDVIDVQPVIERRDRTSSTLVETLPAKQGRFSEVEVRTALANVTELPNYDVLRTGLAKLMHALLDTRP
jgi:hypothetical protein